MFLTPGLQHNWRPIHSGGTPDYTLITQVNNQANIHDGGLGIEIKDLFLCAIYSDSVRCAINLQMHQCLSFKVLLLILMDSRALLPTLCHMELVRIFIFHVT